MTTLEDVEPSAHGRVSAWRIAAGAVLLFIGTVASFKCLGDLKRPLLENVQGQHSIAGNVVGWLLFGLLPIATSVRLWRRRPGDRVRRSGGSAKLPVAAIGSALFAIGLHALLASAEASSEADDMWRSLLVLLPLSVGASIAAAVSFVLAMIALGKAGRMRSMELAAVIASSVSVVVASP